MLHSLQNARAKWYSEKDEIVSMENGQEPVAPETPSVETPSVETPQVPEAGNSPQESSEGHPAWGPIREALGDIQFHKIRPHLQEFDTAAQQRVTDVNSKYEPWKQFADNNVSPDVVARALGIMQGIDSNPVQMYRELQKFLREQNLLEDEVQTPPQQGTPGEVDPDEVEDPRDAALRELQEQQEQVRQFLEAQQQAAREAEYSRQADQALDSEIKAFMQARPNTTREQMGAYLKRLDLHLRAGNHDQTLEGVAAEIDAERNHILSQPRPNDLAPRIPGAGGGAPSGVPQQKDPSQFTREESQAYFADLLQRGQGS